MSAKIDSRQIISISADIKRAMLDACAKDIDNAADILTNTVKNGGKILWLWLGEHVNFWQRNVMLYMKYNRVLQLWLWKSVANKP